MEIELRVLLIRLPTLLQIVKAFEKVSGQTIPFKIELRRNADIAKCLADTELAQQLLNRKTSRSLDQMCADAWRWQQTGGEYMHRDKLSR